MLMAATVHTLAMVATDTVDMDIPFTATAITKVLVISTMAELAWDTVPTTQATHDLTLRIRTTTAVPTSPRVRITAEQPTEHVADKLTLVSPRHEPRRMLIVAKAQECQTFKQ
jgi:hypothetical protein